MNLFMKLFMGSHVGIYRLTGGKLGGNMAGNPILLLDSVGRRSGQKYTTPLAYFMDGNNYIITASAGGADKHPGWYFNLKHNPDTIIQVGANIIPVRAVQADPEEKKRLWAILIDKMPQFKGYEAKTDRDIPMFMMQPRS